MTVKTLTAAFTAALLAVSLTACNRDNAGAGSSADRNKSSSPSGASSAPSGSAGSGSTSRGAGSSGSSK